MFYKLALKNVKRSLRHYFVYFLTLTFGICIFYVFNAIGESKAMLELSLSQEEVIQTLVDIIQILSLFITGILAFLILYANRFMMKRRKKELGIYLTLGMPKRKIGAILLIETIVIGLFALLIGILLGTFLSQFLALYTSRLFEVEFTHFQFMFSKEACVQVVVCFSLIFAIVVVFNSLTVSNYKLIDLLYSQNKNETFKKKPLWLSLTLFAVASICIIFSYILIHKNGMEQIDATFISALVFGGVGTFLFFYSLSGFLLHMVQENPKLYYKNLNHFILRQFNSNIHTNYISMTIICIMLLFAVGILASSEGLNSTVAGYYEQFRPYDVTYGTTKNIRLEEFLKEKGLDIDNYLEEQGELTFYESDIPYSTLLEPYWDKIKPRFQKLLEGSMDTVMVELIPVSQFNKMLEMQNKQPITLQEDEYAVNSNMEHIYDALEGFIRDKRSLTVGEVTLSLAKEKLFRLSLITTVGKNMPIGIIVPDKLCVGYEVKQTYFSGNYYRERIQEADAALIASEAELMAEADKAGIPIEVTYKTVSYQSDIGIKASVIFVGVYLGLIFLLASAAILALQQLSEMSDSFYRYKLLRQLGVDEKMIDKAILVQVALFFGLPLSLALVHAVVGISVANRLIATVGKVSSVRNSIYATGFILLIYGGYFIITYRGCKQMAKQAK